MVKSASNTEVISAETNDNVINIALDTIKKGKQALVFVNTKRSAEKQAEEIAKKIKKGTKETEELAEEVLRGLARPTRQCERLARCVKKGAAFHHAGLTHFQREIIEDSFRNGAVKIICCTPTLAMGIDLPAFRAVIKNLKRYGGKFGMKYIPVLEYLQMAGRAGRPKFDKWGEAICIAKNKPEKQEIYEKYVLGEPEDIFSKLAVEPVLRFYLLSLIATNFVRTRKEIMDFFSKTFWAYQFKDMAELERKIEKMLGTLEAWEFLKMNSGSGSNQEFRPADEIGGEKYTATPLGKRVTELYIDPLTAYEMIEALRKSTALKKLKAFSFLQVICNTLEMRPQLRVGVKEWEEIQEKSAYFEPYLLENEPSIYEPEHDDYLKSVKTALFMEDWINEMDEEHILEKYNVRPGEIRVKLNIGDWLLYAMDELARILQFQPILKEIRRTRIRLKYGVKEELLPLLKLENIGRVRARMLFHNKIKTIADVKKADIGKLVAILGKKVAVSIKDQVGEKVKEKDIKVSESKRKGQMSLQKYNKSSK